ncbi:CDP-glycerol glycerophosphotransferase family protein [Planomicrobium sp. YIM 101495]|uniref:CDP-glycerol glycerophosphotransferase family protein n=1 Tax=Planomicrobium sp. YIM 101495 TaxID=2665160 RepID=UPI0012B9F570|nr:CDP-glycerol glycerophosphotransferase family protein [Planomicrobium sp. YIM 101495]MTD31097.1 CDP-glycerol--glycerophosphate glycerophosphotransferase [Planomicrobium sp. YIM 101495]
MSIELKEQRKFEFVQVYVKVFFAFLLSLFFRKEKGTKTVLVGGNLGEKYEDNASIFHKHLTIHHADEVIAYWMYDPATDYARDKPIPNAVALGSFRNYLLFFQADYTFHGHSLLYDIVPGADKFLFLNRKTVITHISHGIEGFKKILIQKEDIPLLKRTDFFNCASRFEYELKLNEWKIPEHKLIITGFPRFDRYPANTPAPEVKNILMMMTWREWLFDMDEEAFKASAYFRNMVGVLTDSRIRQVMKTHGLQIQVALHPFMKKFEHYFKDFKKFGNGVQFLDFNEASIEQAISANDMLLTDITSVSWDFLYLNKPIVFFMFDQEDFVSQRGTYLDLDTDLYGYKAKTIDDVYSLLKKIAEEGIHTNDWYAEAPTYIDFFDQNNCKRLANRVMGLQ